MCVYHAFVCIAHAEANSIRISGVRIMAALPIYEKYNLYNINNFPATWYFNDNGFKFPPVTVAI